MKSLTDSYRIEATNAAKEIATVVEDAKRAFADLLTKAAQ